MANRKPLYIGNFKPIIRLLLIGLICSNDHYFSCVSGRPDWNCQSEEYNNISFRTKVCKRQIRCIHHANHKMGKNWANVGCGSTARSLLRNNFLQLDMVYSSSKNKNVDRYKANKKHIRFKLHVMCENSYALWE